MFRLTSKVKIAAGLAAGALTLGAAGAYAAANANNTITVTATTISVGKAGTAQLNLIGFNGTTSLTLPTFTNAGECVSFLAQNKNIALGSTGGSVQLSKNYHGKLMSGANEWCKTQLTATTKTDSAETQTPDATDTTAPTDATDSATTHGNGHANGHGKHAQETD
jgi:hypothetical protein